MTTEELKARYGQSEHGHYAVIDTIAVPHSFTIGAKHVEHASKFHSGMLGEETLKAIPCARKGCRLKYRQHEKALLVECSAELKDDTGNANPELHAYLLKCKPLCEEDKFAGFAFVGNKRSAP